MKSEDTVHEFLESLMGAMDPLAVWGAVLSTILAMVKLWEIWKNRIRVEIGYNLSSSSDVGNEVIIRNLSSSPIIITYWELLWCRKHWLRWKKFKEISPNEFSQDLKLGEQSTAKLSFGEQDHFDWSSTSMGSDRIYLRLHIAGQSNSILKKVYG